MSWKSAVMRDTCPAAGREKEKPPFLPPTPPHLPAPYRTRPPRPPCYPGQPVYFSSKFAGGILNRRGVLIRAPFNQAVTPGPSADRPCVSAADARLDTCGRESLQTLDCFHQSGEPRADLRNAWQAWQARAHTHTHTFAEQQSERTEMLSRKAIFSSQLLKRLLTFCPSSSGACQLAL